MMLQTVTETAPNILRLRFSGGRTFMLVGTAHVSKVSVDQVSQLINEYGAKANAAKAAKPPIKAGSQAQPATRAKRGTAAGTQLPQLFLELDNKRYAALTEGTFKNLNIREILRSGQGYFFVAYLLFALLQRRIAAEVGAEPGAEFKRAIALAKRYRLPLTLIDRPAELTLKRAWRLMSLWQQLKFCLGGWGLGSPLVPETATEHKPNKNHPTSTVELIEQLKHKDQLARLLQELARPFPTLKQVVIDERDVYMAENLRLSLLAAPRGFLGIVIVGAGHVQGMLNYWKRLGKNLYTAPPARLRDLFPHAASVAFAANAEANAAAVQALGGVTITLPHKQIRKKTSTQATASLQHAAEGNLKLSSLLSQENLTRTRRFFAGLLVTPAPSHFWKYLKWALPCLILMLFAWGFYRADWETGRQAFMSWVMVNGVLSALGALIAGAHPLTILVAFCAAPITSLNPTIGAGLVAAWFEAYWRPPSVHELETAPLKLKSFAAWWKNQFTKILLVFCFVSLGSAIGTWVALPVLLKIFTAT